MILPVSRAGRTLDPGSDSELAVPECSVAVGSPSSVTLFLGHLWSTSNLGCFSSGSQRTFLPPKQQMVRK